MSQTNLTFLPESNTDFIFAVNWEAPLGIVIAILVFPIWFTIRWRRQHKKKKNNS